MKQLIIGTMVALMGVGSAQAASGDTYFTLGGGQANGQTRSIHSYGFVYNHIFEREQIGIGLNMTYGSDTEETPIHGPRLITEITGWDVNITVPFHVNHQLDWLVLYPLVGVGFLEVENRFLGQRYTDSITSLSTGFGIQANIPNTNLVFDMNYKYYEEQKVDNFYFGIGVKF